MIRTIIISGCILSRSEDDTEVSNDTYIGNLFFDATKFINFGENVTKSR